jgi:hypothetical protein
MIRRQLIVLVSLFAMWPAGAYAQSDILDWVAELSGPGPFNGHLQTVNIRFMCVKNTGGGTHDVTSCVSDTDEKIKFVLDVNFGLAASDSNLRFKDVSPQAPLNALPVREFRIGATYSYRVSPMLDVGAGAGAMIFTGDGFTNQTHPFVTPLAVSWVPFGLVRDPKHPTRLKWGRVLRVRFSERYILGDINAVQDFNALTSTYVKSGEFNANLGLGLDFWSFLPDLLHH